VGSYSFIVRATDGAGVFGDQSFTLQIYSRFRIPLGLISWWRAENDALDSIGTNNGTLINGASFAPGEVNQAFSLDGVNDYVSVPDTTSLHPTSLSFESWILFNPAPTGLRCIANKPLGSGVLDSFGLWWDNGTLNAVIGDATGLGPGLSYPFSPIANRWYHIAFTFDNLTKQQVLYVDGVTVALGVGDRSPYYDSHPLVLGCDIENGTPSFFFQGLIDEAALYGRAITAQEVNAIRDAGTAGKRTFFPLESWNLAHFGNPDVSVTGDSDKDGLPDLLEYAIGTDPQVANLGPTITVQTNGNGTRQLKVSLTRDPAKNDITITVESSGDLQTWAPIATSTNGSVFTGTANISGEVGGTAPRLVTIVDPNVQPAKSGKRFLHITVTH
jgi:hypothetical protein